jgi:IS30 family transposase
MGEKRLKDVEPEFYTTSIVAKKSGRSGETIRREIKRGKLKAYRFNSDYMIRPSDYQEWISKYFKEIA